jgi:hypothetical protein
MAPLEPPADRGAPIWGVQLTESWWPDVAKYPYAPQWVAPTVETGMTWDDAYDRVIVLRDVLAVHSS